MTPKRCTHCGGIIHHITEATTYRGYLIHKGCADIAMTFSVRCRVVRNVVIDEEWDVVQILKGEDDEITWN